MSDCDPLRQSSHPIENEADLNKLDENLATALVDKSQEPTQCFKPKKQKLQMKQNKNNE